MSEGEPDLQTIRPPISDAPDVAQRRVLIVDDEPALATSFARLLGKAGFETKTAHDGNEAVRAIMESPFSVVVSDIHMPGTSGVELLRVIRAYDLDVPVILMTGGPDLQTAMQAVELGALKYLCKPIDPDELLATVKRAARLREMARFKREALLMLGMDGNAPADRAGLAARLDQALATARIALQPVVSVRGKRTVGYEVLMRSSEPLLRTPGDVLDAAERLGRVHEVGRAMRELAAEAMARLPEPALLFVNVHAQDLLDPQLADASAPLGKFAERVVLEVSERASLDDIPEVAARISILRYVGYRLALDDLGVGHAGLSSFARCEPEFVKLDMSLVRAVDQSPTRQRLVKGICSLCAELEATVIAEGVETIEEREALRDFGCDLMQGFFFARPAFEPPVVAWST